MQNDIDQDESEYLVLSNYENDRREAANALFRAFNQAIMCSMEFHHAGPNVPDQKKVLPTSIERFCEVSPSDTIRLKDPLKPQRLRSTTWVNTAKYRKVTSTQQRELGDLIRSVP